MSKTAKGVMQLTIATFVFMASGYIINLWLGRILTIVDYGIYGVVISIMNAINVIQSTGIPRATSKIIAEDKNKADDIFSGSIILQIFLTIILTVVLLISAPYLANLFNDQDLTKYIRISALILPFYALFTVQMSYYNGLLRFSRQSIIHITYSVSKIITIPTLALIHGLKGVFIGFIISPMLAVLAGVRKYRFGKNRPFREIITYSSPLVAFAVLSTLQLTIDLFFVKAILTDANQAGYYTAAQNIAYLPFYAFSAFSYVLLPSVSSLMAKEGIEGVRNLLKKTIKIIIGLLILVTAIVCSTSQELTILLYTNKFVEAASALSILVIGIAFLTLFAILSNILSGAGLAKYATKYAAIGLAAICILCYLLIPKYGLQGAAVATTVGNAISMFLAIIKIKKNFDYSPEVIPTLSYLAAGLLAAGTTYLLSTNIFMFFVACLFGLMVYLVVLILLRQISLNEIINIFGLLNKRIIKNERK
jgi:stage V sporulation protein B